MLKTDAKRVIKLAEAGAELCASILTGVFPTLILFAQALLILSVVGGILIMLRIVLIAIAPHLASSSKLVAAAVNVFMDVFAILMESIKLTIFEIEVVIEVLSFGAYHPKPFSAVLKFPKPISANEIVTFSNICANTCPEINSIGTVFNFLAPQIFHGTFCPILRASKPISIVGPILQAFLGWGVQGDFTTHPYGNCEELEPMHPKSTCVILAIGIIIAEFFIPLLLAGIILRSSGSVIWRLLVAVMENILTALELVYDVLEVVVKFLNLAPQDKPRLAEVREPLIQPPHTTTESLF